MAHSHLYSQYIAGKHIFVWLLWLFSAAYSVACLTVTASRWPHSLFFPFVKSLYFPRTQWVSDFHHRQIFTRCQKCVTLRGCAHNKTKLREIERERGKWRISEEKGEKRWLHGHARAQCTATRETERERARKTVGESARTRHRREKYATREKVENWARERERENGKLLFWQQSSRTEATKFEITRAVDNRLVCAGTLAKRSSWLRRI